MIKNWMFGKRLYQWLRRLHLYVGLFLCPFLLIFAVSTIRLNHGLHRPPTESTHTEPLSIPDDMLNRVTKRRVLRNMTQNEKRLAREALVQHIVTELDLTGEIGGLGAVRNGQTIVSAARPGLTTRVVVNIETQEATITDRSQGIFGTMRYLHLNPGPHRHPNWIATKAWGWVADSTVYGAVFLTLSGVYLWLFIRAERKMGLIVLGAGCASFVGILYALLIA